MARPVRDGRSAETNCRPNWSPKGENLAWRIPIGGRSAPVVFGNRLYLNSPVGDRPTRRSGWSRSMPKRQGRLGAAVQHLPERRAAASRGVGVAAVDPATGNIYMFTVGAPARLRCAGREKFCGTARCRKNTAPSPRTAAGRRRRSSKATRSSSTRCCWRGAIWTVPAIATSRSTSAPARRSGSARRRRATTTPITRRRSSPTSTARDALIVGGTDGVFHALKVNTGEPVWRIECQQARDSQQRAVSATASPTSRTAKRTSAPPRWAWSPRSTRAGSGELKERRLSSGGRAGSCRPMPRR